MNTKTEEKKEKWSEKAFTSDDKLEIMENLYEIHKALDEGNISVLENLIANGKKKKKKILKKIKKKIILKRYSS
jgi:galactokinase/mevalonate kinase-like predicted kinase